MNFEWPLVCALLLLGVWGAIHKRKLTVAGAIGGGLIGLCLYFGVGVLGILLLATFFIAGTLATGWQASKKSHLVSEGNDGPRQLGQVLANGGAAGILGLLGIFFPAYQALLLLMIAGAFSTAMADTLSSELGTVYGKQFYNVLTFRKDQRGMDGVVSAEGFGIGILGSALVAAIYCVGIGWSTTFGLIVLAGTLGNLTDSFLGAALERRGWLKNDWVNFLATAVGSLVCWIVSA